MRAEPIVVELEVRAPVAHAFDVWTARCGTWWPRSHTVSGSDQLEIVFEPFVGGRVFEKAPDGTEHEWGEVLRWDPPNRLEYLWHIFVDRDKATHVTVTFTESAQGSIVRLENSGFEVFGEAAEERIPRVGSSWSSIIGQYADSI